MTKTFGLSMGDLLGLLDISEDSIANAAISRSETGVVLVSHEQCGNLFLAIGMRIQCDHGVAEITELNDQDATITPLATNSATTLPIADLVFQEGFEILDHQ
ncbi:hypothetical protein [Gordonia sp. i37]|uniref:hypothetical protein n=1 Tax=Gordonia sp. i37 TaxID=1961707 RepID=UPI0009ACE3B8|nr:hypothetical protein [Gordonia sp. i37]OPX15881.1 hypothetical protein B1964_07650 [Gordonia sp. i37]